MGERRVAVIGLVAGLVGALVVSVLPAVAASVGDPLALGEVNRIDERTDWKGRAKGAVVQVKNTGNSSAVAAKADRQAIVAKATDGPVAVNAKADRVAVKIKVDPGQAPIKVNATAGTATNLSADQLDGLDANDLVRAASASSPNLPDGDDASFVGGSAELLTASITAPRAGLLVMSASVDSTSFGTFDAFACRLEVGGEPVEGSEMFAVVDSSEGNGEEDCTTTGVLAVPAGTHAVDLAVGRSVPFPVTASVHADTDFFAGALWVLFVPFDGAGGAPAIGDATPSDLEGATPGTKSG